MAQDGQKQRKRRKEEMKSWRKLLAVLLAMAVALSCVPGCGLEVKAAVSGDFKYEVNEDGNSVEITGYAGSG